jgi:DNA-binding CsgD family transcriptional regulator
LRNDPRTWRLELLTALVSLLPATVAAAFILKMPTGPAPREAGGEKNPLVVSIFDVGFKLTGQREAFLTEFNTAPFQDPLSRLVLDKIAAASEFPCFTHTAVRSELIDDAAWHASPHVQHHRHAAGLDDCIISAHRRHLVAADAPDSPHGGGATVMVLCAFRAWDDPRRFTPRERILLNTLHTGLKWMYRAEEATHRLTRASALSPRLRQTLDFLLAGETERRVAQKMNISAHTVHDYVKALYIHFGVSSRGELLSRWIQSGGQLPRPSKDQ